MARLPLPLRLLVRDARAETEIIYPWELPSIMRKHILTGAMGTVYFVLLSGIYLVALGNRLGMTYWHWGLLSAASSFVLLLQLLSAYLVSLTGSRRGLWFAAAMVGRLLRGVALAAAFVFFRAGSSRTISVFILLIVAANCFEAIAAPPWFSWLADIIPHSEHGRFMGRRNAWIALANLCVVVPLGYGVDRLGEGLAMPALMGVFAFGLALGILDLVIHRTIPEPRMAMPARKEFWQEVRGPLRNGGFRWWLAFNAAWTFAITLGGALATVYFIEDLGIKRNLLGGSLVLIMAPLVGTVFTGKVLGSMVDRQGVKRMLLWGHLLWAVVPLIWIPATPATALLWLGAAALVGGVGATTALTAANKLITRLPPPGHVPMYVAVSTCVGSLSGACAALCAGLLLQALHGLSWQIGPVTVGGFHVLFAASAVLCGASTALIRRIGEPVAPSAPPAAA